MVSDVWNHAEVIDELVRLFRDTKKTMAEITKALNDRFHLGLSRNAVIGKIGRMRLAERFPLARRENHGNDIRRRSERKVRVANASRSVGDVVTEVLEVGRKSVPEKETPSSDDAVFSFKPPAVVIPIGEPITIYDLRENTCHWPLGEMHDRPPYMYCGQATVATTPYCRNHCRVSYISGFPPAKKK